MYKTNFTIEDIKEAIEAMKPKTVFMNKNSYEVLLENIDFVPDNVVINSHLADNQAAVFTGEVDDYYYKFTD